MNPKLMTLKLHRASIRLLQTVARASNMPQTDLFDIAMSEYLQNHPEARSFLLEQAEHSANLARSHAR